MQTELTAPKRRGSRKATDAQIIGAYAQFKNVWRAAEFLGMCGQSVHERLVRLGAINKQALFTEAENSRLRADHARYADAGQLDVLAAEMGRPKTSLCRQARALGLTSTRRKKPYSDSSNMMKAWHASHDHPRGMLGKRHTPEVCAAVSAAHTARWAAMSEDERAATTLKQLKARAAKSGLIRPRPETTWKAGWREIGGIRKFYRSRWEANYARYLEWLRERGEIQKWEHEPETFWFEKVKRGVRTFLPDFRVTENSGRVVYHEVKGWMDDRSKTKIRRLKKYHPKVELIVIERKGYESVKRQVSKLIPGWE